MFWCSTCECAYPHGPEGPGAGLRQHTAAAHGIPSAGPKPITGARIMIGFSLLVLAALVARVFGYTLM